jgi:hypothetical protein
MTEPVVGEIQGDLASNAAEATQALFPEQPTPNLRRRLVGVGISLAALGIALRNGLDPSAVKDVLDTTIAPSPGFVPEIVDGMVLANEGIRAAAPVVLAGGLTVRAAQRYRANATPYNRWVEDMASKDYSGTDDIVQAAARPNRLARARGGVARFAGGVGVAALVALFAGGSSGVEHEVSNGPLRPVRAVFGLLAQGDTDRHVVVQSPSATFMSDTFLGLDEFDELAAEADAQGAHVVPFIKILPDIDGNSGLVIGIPSALLEQEMGISDADPDCDSLPAIVDEANGTPVGETVDINGVDAQVVGQISDTTQMNRDVAIMSTENVAACIEGTEDPTAFGAVVSGEGSEDVVQDLMAEANLPGTIITEERFEANNRSFWRKNGTPIIDLLIFEGAAIGIFAIASAVRAKLQHHVREIGIMVAGGADMAAVRAIEARRALKDATKAMVLSAPLLPVVAATFNAAEFGLKVGVGARELAVGYTVALGAKMAGSLRAIRRFGKDLDLPKAVSG